MDKKQRFVLASLLVLAICGFTPIASARPHGYGYKMGHGWGLESIFFYKAHFMLENQAELGLSEEQVKLIQDLKQNVKKLLIKQQADIDILAIDIKAKLHDDPVDVAAINALIDQKYEIKKAKTKSLVDAIAKLKGTLTDQQREALKDLWKKSISRNEQPR